MTGTFVSSAPHTPAGASSGPCTGAGTFTGGPVGARYGTVQVTAPATGEITVAKVLREPDRPVSAPDRAHA
ncbi:MULTISPECIES: hypothetical protein [unclassified Streptomyces]|uniref:hypothetical protein n=1 Tax=unclassified Streptomyces TaxID=2593676 RepID=UPI002E134DA8|nr:hypothetical protein OG452_04765 [Streptomyces sp. NBC_01197]WSS52547.1 hypothetical protein OG708_30315 [Streptomyces sp. NBC_01180]